MALKQQDLKSTLWEAANILRGSAVDRTDWKGYILPLFFFKRICDVWDEETAEASEIYGDADPSLFPEIHRFHVPEGCHWRDIREKSVAGFQAFVDVLDLAEIYGVTTKRLNEQVRRNKGRFPEDFMFGLTSEEFANLKSQFATLRWGGRRYPPNAFTEHGAVMPASVLNSPIAIESSIQVVRAFVRLREMLVSHKDLAHKLAALEKEFDQQFQVVFDVIRKLMEAPPDKSKRKVGFN